MDKIISHLNSKTIHEMVIEAFYRMVGGRMFKHVKMMNGEQHDMPIYNRIKDRPRDIHSSP